MSIQYDKYLKQHKANVAKGYYWLREKLPELFMEDTDYEWTICVNHDYSKTNFDEYDAYDAYFYGENKSHKVLRDFREAWLKHIHRNRHHWQHWVLINDDPNEGEIVLDMPHVYIIEMICDWWAFSWNKGNLDEIFSWYDEHKNYIKLSDKTRQCVESTLSKIKEKLEELES